MATRILPGIVNRFIQGRPDVRPLLTSSGSRFLIEWVTAQKSDLGIGLLGKDRPGVQLVKIMQVEGVCAAPPGHPLSAKNVIVPSNLDNLPFIDLTTEDETQFLVEAFFRRSQERR